jgi:hypothetical protein
MSRLARLAHFLFWSPKRGSPWVIVSVAVLFVFLGLSAVTGLIGYTPVGWIWLAMAAGYAANGAYMFVDRRKNPTPLDPQPGHVWAASDGRELTIEGIDGDIVRCSRYDPRTGVTDAWVGSWDRFQELVGLGRVAGHQPPRPQRA